MAPSCSSFRHADSYRFRPLHRPVAHRRSRRRVSTTHFTVLNQVSTVGALLLGVAMLPFMWNVIKSSRYGEVVTVDDPWGTGNSLEWATGCPPPRHNFTELPRIRSERPAFELHYPYMSERMRTENHNGAEKRQAGSVCPTCALLRSLFPAAVRARSLDACTHCSSTARAASTRTARSPPRSGRTRVCHECRTRKCRTRPGPGRCDLRSPSWTMVTS